MNSDEIKEENHSQYAMQLATSSVLPMVLKATVELGLLDIIERAGPGALLSPAQIASELPTHNPDAPMLLDRLLCLLSSHSVLACSLSPDQSRDGKILRLYGLAPVAMYFVRNGIDGVSLAPLLCTMQDKAYIDIWYHLKDAVLEGGHPCNRAHGMNMVEYVRKDSRFGELFQLSMKEFNPIFMKRILEIYEGFKGLTSLVDVGGGDGANLNMIIPKYPAIKGINFDLPAILDKSSSFPGIEHCSGDMFVNIPKGETIFMKWILHGWDDEHCLIILKNCYEALPESGKVIVVDMVILEAPETSLAARSLYQFDTFMMNNNITGKERTKREFEGLAKAAGFSSICVACSAYDFSVVELFK
ncbi:caffeic acid 3-O-methyltransferase-like [Humulus lupulus]|uniref:caffeic acid 3-O-methyltransferase-like n=1 Tax=Humulus lupulus TaxID=3486 RepID=UPI002B402B30|nr:caffeic acid 3-O-methyltransferase-like [Humulus lupulus]